MYTLYTDGSAIPNPGPCGCGAVLLDENDTIVWTLSEFLGEGTNNVGELTAILRGCTRAQEMGVKDISVYSDSELSVHLLTDVKKTKKEHLQSLVNKIAALRAHAEFDTFEVKWIKAHNNHTWNEFADKLANSAVSISLSQTPSQSQFATPTSYVSRQSTTYADTVAKIHLKCPFGEKDQVKKLGARWDAESKTWWVADSTTNRSTFAKWIV